MKKIIYIFCIAILLCGCTSKTEEKNLYVKDTVQVKDYSLICHSGDKYYLGNIEAGEEHKMTKTAYIDLNSENMDITEIETGCLFDGNYFQYDMFSDEFYVMNVADKIIERYDTEYNKLGEVDLTDYIKYDDFQFEYYGSDRDNIFFQTCSLETDFNNLLIVLNREFELIYCDECLYDTDLYIENVGYVFGNETEITENGNWKKFNNDIKSFDDIQIDNLDNKKWKKLFDEGFVVDGDSENDFYYANVYSESDSKEINIKGIKNNKESIIFNYYDNGLNPNTNNRPIYMNSETVIFFDCDNNEFIRFRKDNVDSNSQSSEDTTMNVNKEKIIIAGLEEYPFENVMLNYSLQSDKYEIEYINYGKDKDYNTAAKALFNDVLKGDKINAILLAHADKKAYVDNGVLADLNGFLDDNSSVKKADFVPGIIDEITSDDGGIYSLFTTYSLVGYTSKLSDNVQISNITDLMNTNDMNRVVVAGDSNSWILGDLLRYSGDEIIDYTNCCIRDESELRKILELISNQSNGKSVSSIGSPVFMANKNETMFSFAEFKEVSYSLVYNQIHGENYNITNYCVDAPIIVPSDNEIGVVKGSEDKVYDFLEYMFKSESVINTIHIGGYCVLNDLMEDNYRTFYEKDPFLNVFGDTVDYDGLDINFWDESGAEIEFTVNPAEIDKTEVDHIREMVESAVYVEPMREDLQNAIIDASADYLEGEGNLDDAMTAVNKAVENCLRENR